jgi:oligopeptide transport system substrate-binding protein
MMQLLRVSAWTVLMIAVSTISLASSSEAQIAFRRGTASDPPSLDPNKTNAQSAGPIIKDMFLTLVEAGPDLAIGPAAAESWSRSDDGLVYTFHLKPGLTWSDGVPVTAGDFQYSFRRFLDPKTAAIFASFLYPIANARAINGGALPVEELGVDVVDDLTLRIRLERPVPYLIDLLAQETFPPVPRHVIEAYGDAWTKPGIMVSNGAYVLAERVPQSYIKLVKNPRFYDADNVQIDEVYFYPTQDLNTTFNRFRAGELDLILSFPPDKIDWIKENMPEALQVTPALGLYYLHVLMTDPVLEDLRLRRALSLAIDREIIADDLLRTGVKPAYSFLSPDFSSYSGIELEEEKMSFAERQALARDLLGQAGYDPDKPLKIVYTYDGQEESRKVAVALQGMWNAVGIEAELVDKEFRALIKDRLTGNYQVLRTAFFSPIDDPYFFLELLETGNPGNNSRYSNPAFDELLRRSSFAATPAEREALMMQAERLAMADQPVIPIFYYVWRRLVQPYVKGWKESAIDNTATRYLRIEKAR